MNHSNLVPELLSWHDFTIDYDGLFMRHPDASPESAVRPLRLEPAKRLSTRRFKSYDPAQKRLCYLCYGAQAMKWH